MNAERERRAIVVGAKGQDGRILSESLEADGVVVAGLARDSLKLTGQPDEPPVDILDGVAVDELIRRFAPDEVYYLAAHHGSSEADRGTNAVELMRRSYDVHVGGYQNFLDAGARYDPAVRFFYAASSHVFGWPDTMPQSEDTPFDPQCAYGITKAAGVFLGRSYRRTHRTHAASGILYTHESVFRAPGFASRRIVDAVAAIAVGRAEKLTIGDPHAIADWGYAGDTVLAMRLIVGLEAPGDYIVATGQAHTVRDFVAEAFSAAGIDNWEPRVQVDPALIAGPPRHLVGDSARLRRATGWAPSMEFSAMVRMLVEYRLNEFGRESEKAWNQSDC